MKVFWIRAVHSSLCVPAVPLVLQRLVPSPWIPRKQSRGSAVLRCRRFPHNGCGGDAARPWFLGSAALDSAGCQCQCRSWSRVNCSSVLVAAGVVPMGCLCSWCMSPYRAEVALCCGMWVNEGQGVEGRRPPRPRVLVWFPPQPLTVPDRTVDVRLCTERRAGREGEEEAQARSSRAVRFKLTFCFVGVEVRRPGRQHCAGPPSFIRSYVEERGQEQGILPVLVREGDSRCPGHCWAQTLEAKAPSGTQAGRAHCVPKVLRSAPLRPALGALACLLEAACAAPGCVLLHSYFRCQSLNFSSLIFSC